MAIGQFRSICTIISMVPVCVANTTCPEEEDPNPIRTLSNVPNRPSLVSQNLVAQPIKIDAKSGEDERWDTYSQAHAQADALVFCEPVR